METDAIKQLNPLNLAFIGDAVFEGFIRERVFKNFINSSIVVLHRMSVKYVSAKSQSFVMGRLELVLNDTETTFYKRGRNMKSGHVPKNASVADYRRATGFESLLGYLHLSGQLERLNEIMGIAAQIIEKEMILDETRE